MRRFSIACICLTIGLAALVGATAAEAEVNLGSVVQPTGSSTESCSPVAVLVQETADPGVSYTVPAGGGKVTRWEVNAVSSTAGAPLTFVVLRPAGEGSYEVVATAAETLPSPLPADGVASFTPANPPSVSAGDTFGLVADASGATCAFFNGETPVADRIGGLLTSGAVVPGQTLRLGLSESGFQLNLAVTLQNDQDIGVTAMASPPEATVGTLAVLGSTVTNHGPASGPVTFTDTIPPGLIIDSAVAGSGACTTAGQTVSCRIDGLAAGQSAPVAILVTPTAAGSYVNTVSVAPPADVHDPTAADDGATARLDVGAAPEARTVTTTVPKTVTTTKILPGVRACIVPNFRGVTLTTARHLLRPLGCKAGRVRHVHSRTIARGMLIRTSPKSGTYAAGRKVGLVVSSGLPRHRHPGRN